MMREVDPTTGQFRGGLGLARTEADRIARSMQSFEEEMRRADPAVGSFTGSLGLSASQVERLSQRLESANSEVNKLSRLMREVDPSAGQFRGSLALTRTEADKLATEMVKLEEDMRHADSAAGSFTGSLGLSASAVDRLVKGFRAADNATGSFKGTLGLTKREVDDLTGASMRTGAAAENFARMMREVDPTVGAFKGTLNLTRSEADRLGKAIAATGEETKKYSAWTDEATKKTNVLGGAAHFLANMIIGLHRGYLDLHFGGSSVLQLFDGLHKTTRLLAEDGFQPLKNLAQASVHSWSEFSSALADVGKRFGPLISGIQAVGESLMGFLQMVGQIVVGVGVLGSAMSYAAGLVAVGSLGLLQFGAAGIFVMGILTMMHKQLSKAFQPVVNELQNALMPTFDKAINQVILPLLNTLLPALKSGFIDIADAVFSGAAGFQEWIKTGGGLGVISDFIHGIATMIREATPGIGAMVEGFLRMTANVNTWRQLGDIVTVVGQGLGQLFDELNNTGLYTQGLSALRALLYSLMPAFNQLVEGVTKAFIAGTPGVQAFFDSLSTAFSEIDWTLVGRTFGDVAAFFGKLLEVGAPVINLIMQFTQQLAQALTPVLAALQPYIQTIATEIGQALTQALQILAPMLPGLAQAFGAFLQAIIPVALSMLPALTSAFAFLIPTLIRLMPVILMLVAEFQMSSGAFEGLAIMIIGSIAAIVQALTGDLSGAVKTGAQAMVVGARTMGTSWQEGMQTMKLATETNWNAIADQVQQAGLAAQRSVNQTMNGMSGAVDSGTGRIRERASSVLGRDVPAFARAGFDDANRNASDGMDGMLWSVIDGTGTIQGVFSGLPKKMQDALGDPNFLEGVGESIIDGLVTGIKVKAMSALTSTLQWVTDLIPIWKGPAEKDRVLLHGTGQLIMQGLTNGLAEGAQGVRSFLQSFTTEVSGSMNGTLTATGSFVATPVIRGNAGTAVTVAPVFQGNHLMSERDMDIFLQKMGPALVRMLQQGGVYVRA
ncbi:hypothetical protein ORV05_05000 [Amycolatopsis cynarae]|uniref:Tape measure protein n=1 Tax=Amycolatopsis cynarae TaxID=2995223 RepID=A0ABY7B4A9_9PSEU|nr:hypothetical protein [Amycolatopsis sp. HUAS 11-8]WAL67150.1 hypothetical protein ORV05_05000 [Amycolatopsis sp. HUAS 11-8]